MSLALFNGWHSCASAYGAVAQMCGMFGRSRITPIQQGFKRSLSTSAFSKAADLGGNHGKPKIAGLLMPRKAKSRRANLVRFFFGNPYVPVLSIGIADIAVYLGWKFASRHPRLMDFMERNFTVSYRNLAQGRFWTLATASISHCDLWSAISSLNSIFTCGLPLAQVIGGPSVLSLYFGSSALSYASLIALDVRRAKKARSEKAIRKLTGVDSDLYLGGNCAGTSLLTAYALGFPHSVIMANGYVRLPVVIEAIATWVYDFVNLGKEQQTGIPHSGHFTGALCGALWYFLFVKRRGK